MPSRTHGHDVIAPLTCRCWRKPGASSTSRRRSGRRWPRARRRTAVRSPPWTAAGTSGSAAPCRFDAASPSRDSVCRWKNSETEISFPCSVQNPNEFRASHLLVKVQTAVTCWDKFLPHHYGQKICYMQLSTSLKNAKSSFSLPFEWLVLKE